MRERTAKRKKNKRGSIYLKERAILEYLKNQIKENEMVFLGLPEIILKERLRPNTKERLYQAKNIIKERV